MKSGQHYRKMQCDLATYPLHEKCPYFEFFWSVFSRIRTEYVFRPNAGKCGPEKTPNTSTFHAVIRPIPFNINGKS